MSDNKYKVYFGTQSYPPNEEMQNNNVLQSAGIYSAVFDADCGDLSDPVLCFPMKTSSFFALDEQRKILYATGVFDPGVSNFSDKSNETGDNVCAFHLDNDEPPHVLSVRKSGGKTACHVALSPDRCFLAVSNYSSGSLSVFDIDSEGKIGNRIFFKEYQGSGPNKKRQEQSHIHSAFFLRTGTDLRLFVLDLGCDRLYILKYNEELKNFSEDPDYPFFRLFPGCGPRHAAFLPLPSEDNKEIRILFVLNELNSTICSIRLEFESEKMKAVCLGYVSSIPNDFRLLTSDRSECFGSEAAEIELSYAEADPVLYVSNRGHNSITVFRLDEFLDPSVSNPEPELIQSQSTFGVFPRYFSTDPNGKWLLTCNERSGGIIVFKRNIKDGTLTPLNQEQKRLAWPLIHIFTKQD